MKSAKKGKRYRKKADILCTNTSSSNSKSKDISTSLILAEVSILVVDFGRNSNTSHLISDSPKKAFFAYLQLCLCCKSARKCVFSLICYLSIILFYVGIWVVEGGCGVHICKPRSLMVKVEKFSTTRLS